MTWIRLARVASGECCGMCRASRVVVKGLILLWLVGAVALLPQGAWADEATPTTTTTTEPTGTPTAPETAQPTETPTPTETTGADAPQVVALDGEQFAGIGVGLVLLVGLSAASFVTGMRR